MIRFRFILLLLLIASGGVNAQTVIGGKIVDKENREPIKGVVITLLDGTGEILTYDISKQDGSFNLRVKSDLSRLTLHARLLGYNDEKREIENREQQLTIAMSFGETVLREVVVKSDAIWNRNDTLVYSVEAFRNTGDRSIGDLLRRLPGVEVSESGGIKYQGESINRFYIEGLDLLENRYGIATNNVPVDAVQNVEVLENHQPLNALRDLVPSEKAAINLRLKKERMSRPAGTVTLGTGDADGLLWLAEAFALSAGRNRQYIVMYKGNNAAMDIGRELTEQSLAGGDAADAASGYSPVTLLSARSFSPPPLERKRYLFNKSHTASLNNLHKTGEHSQLRINIQYLHDEREESILRNSEYYLPDGNLQISESSALTHRTHKIDAALTYSDNSPGHYLNNALRWSGGSDRSASAINLNGMGVTQEYRLPSQLIRNNLQYVKRWGERLWDFSSFMAYSSQPQQLTVEIDTTEAAQQQDVTLSGFYTRNSTYYSLGWGSSSVTLTGVAEASLDRYESALIHPLLSDSTVGEMRSSHLLLELAPSYLYRGEKLTIQADLPLRRQVMQFGEEQLTYLHADPSLRFNYRFNPMLRAHLAYRSSHSLGDFTDMTGIWLLSGYRSLSKRGGLLPESRRSSYSTGFQYRNPISSFFLNSTLAYAPSQRNSLTSQRFIGNESVTGITSHSTRTDQLLWSAYAGKYIPAIRTNLSLNVSYNSMKGERLQQGVLYPFRAAGWVLMPKLSIKLSDDASLTYQEAATLRTTEIGTQEESFRSSLWQMARQLSAFWQVDKRWQLNGRLEHSMNEIREGEKVKRFFADAGISYRHSRLELSLTATNLFNQADYSYTLYSGLDRFDYRYNLRPRMLLLSLGYHY